jgi:hypothetical protein
LSTLKVPHNTIKKVKGIVYKRNRGRSEKSDQWLDLTSVFVKDNFSLHLQMSWIFKVQLLVFVGLGLKKPL